jgi:hypothetical protein
MRQRLGKRNVTFRSGGTWYKETVGTKVGLVSRNHVITCHRPLYVITLSHLRTTSRVILLVTSLRYVLYLEPIYSFTQTLTLGGLQSSYIGLLGISTTFRRVSSIRLSGTSTASATSLCAAVYLTLSYCTFATWSRLLPIRASSPIVLSHNQFSYSLARQ